MATLFLSKCKTYCKYTEREKKNVFGKTKKKNIIPFYYLILKIFNLTLLKQFRYII